MKNTAVLMVMVGFFLSGCSSKNPPECDSYSARSTLTEAFNNSQHARMFSLSVVEVEWTIEQGYDESSGVRECYGRIYLNNANSVGVSFDMKARKGGKFMLEFKIN